MISVRVREAVAADDYALARLNAVVHQLHVDARPDHFKPLGVEELTLWFATLREQPETGVWVATRESELVGYAVANQRQLDENQFCYRRRWLEIDQIGVLAEARRQGVARALVARVIEEANRLGIHEIMLRSWDQSQRPRRISPARFSNQDAILRVPAGYEIAHPRAWLSNPIRDLPNQSAFVSLVSDEFAQLAELALEAAG